LNDAAGENHSPALSLGVERGAVAVHVLPRSLEGQDGDRDALRHI